MRTSSTRRRRTTAAVVVLSAALSAAVGAAVAPAPAAPVPSAGLVAPGNNQAIVIDSPTSDTGKQTTNPYPSSTKMLGIDGPITDVNVDLNYVTFGHAKDIDIVLKSPEGTAVLLVSDACGDGAVIQNYWTIDDEAAADLPASGCSSGTWQPTDVDPAGDSDVLPGPAPLNHQQSLSAFNGENPNGTWQLFVHDDQNRYPDGADHAVILQGFRVIIETQTRPIVVPGEADGDGPASVYPYSIPVSGKTGVIKDVFVYLHNISHNRPDDLEILLVAPGGQKVLLMSDACGHFALPNATTWRINDRDAAMSDNGNCLLGGSGGGGVNFSPTSYEPGDSLPAPAPPAPYATSLLRNLYGTDPNGTWKVYIADDYDGAGSGYVRDVSISFTLGPPSDLEDAPETELTRHPNGVMTSRRATFGFTSDESPVTFRCRLDDGEWRACTSPKTYERLARGRHVFRVAAVDFDGNRDPSPARWEWRIRR